MLKNKSLDSTSIKLNLTILISSITLVWFWVFLSTYIDTNNDKGLLTVLGFILITSFVTSFYSPNSILKLILTFSIFCLLAAFVLLNISVVLIYYFKVNKVVLMVILLILLSFILLLMLRQYLPSINNKQGLFVFAISPLATFFILKLILFSGNIFFHGYGIGVSIGTYLTILFCGIHFLNKWKLSSV